MTPQIQLRPITAEELESFLAASQDRYTQERVTADHLSPEEAKRFVTAQRGGLLPQGVATPGHGFFTIVGSDTEAAIGQLWLYYDADYRQAFIYDLTIFPSWRRQGFGQAALLAAEQWARRQGAGCLGLNVFTANAAAVQLYRQAGYQATSQYMNKPMDSPQK